MSIEFLITLTYAAATLFMMSLCWGIGVVTAMRRGRIRMSEPLPQIQIRNVSGKFQVIGQPFGEWREWNKNRRDNTSRIDTNVVMPMRYQQPLFFTDPHSETKTQNPEKEAAIAS